MASDKDENGQLNTEDDIHALKKLEPGEEISNWMGWEELADNIFRAAQTDAAMKPNKVQGKERANRTHFEVGNKIREFIIHELGNATRRIVYTREKYQTT
jgi:DNA-damage-inducible protein D